MTVLKSNGPRLCSTEKELLERYPSLSAHQSYPEGSTRARLAKLLNGLLITGKVPRSNIRSKIGRKHCARMLNLDRVTVASHALLFADYEAVLHDVEPVASAPNARFGIDLNAHAEDRLNNDAKRVVVLYPSLKKHQFYEGSRNAQKLVAELNQQIIHNCVERSRAGKLNRTLLSERTGIRLTVLCSTYLHITEDYQKALGKTASVHEERIPEMRGWLEDRIADGSLEVHNGKFTRNRFLAHFGYPENGTLDHRYPAIRELYEQFDKKIIDIGYQSNDVKAKLFALKAVLSGQPPIGSNGWSINRTTIGEQVGLPYGASKRTPYIEPILHAEERIKKGLVANPLISLIGGSLSDFTPLVEQGWPEPFVVRAKKSFERHLRVKPRGEVQDYYLSTTEMFTFLSDNKSFASLAVKEGLISGARPSSLGREWAIATQEYRDVIAAKYQNAGTGNNKLHWINKILRNFGNDGVLPPLEIPLISLRHDTKTHLRSIAEVSEQTEAARLHPSVDDYLTFATSMLSQAASRVGIEYHGKENNDFNDVLRSELEAEKFTAADSPASVILRVLNRRLKLLEDAALKAFEEAMKVWELGQLLLSKASNPGADWEKMTRRGDINESQRKEMVRRHFPLDVDGDTQGISNLLSIVVDKCGSVFPSQTGADENERFIISRASEYGGTKVLQRYLSPATSALSAVLTLYLLGSGSNVSVGRTLEIECVQTSEEPKHSKVTGFKARAGGKPIFATLEDRSPSIRGLRWLQRATECLRPHAAKANRGLLFLSKISKGVEVKLLGEEIFREDFKRLVASIPELSGVNITPNMLRPSVLLKATLESEGRTRISLALGQHGPNVNQGYTNKFPTRYLHDIDIRHFMHSMETLVIQNVEEAHEFLNVDKEKFGGRVEAVMKTGLGTMCADRHARPGNEGAACKSIDCWNDCPQLIVIARKEDMAILQIWQHSLRAVEGDWVRDQPDRWAAVWLPWLCFVDAVEMKMRSSIFAPIWHEAIELASEIKATPEFKPMRLY
jgi:hypothetical protein